MDLPIQFPNDANVIAEEVAQFRALSPDEQIRAICDLNRLYCLQVKASGREAEIAELEALEKAAERRAIMDFVARHTPVEPDVVVESRVNL